MGGRYLFLSLWLSILGYIKSWPKVCCGCLVVVDGGWKAFKGFTLDIRPEIEVWTKLKNFLERGTKLCIYCYIIFRNMVQWYSLDFEDIHSVIQYTLMPSPLHTPFEVIEDCYCVKACRLSQSQYPGIFWLGDANFMVFKPCK